MSAADPRSQPTWCFSVFAAPEPGVMPRVLEVFARRDLVPACFHGEVIEDGPDGLVIDVHVGGLAADAADHLAAVLRNFVGVERVLTAVKRGAVPVAGAR